MIPVITVVRVLYFKKHRGPRILEFKGNKLANIWHYKILMLFMDCTGLSTIYFENSLKSKIVLQIFLVCSLFSLIFCVQILIGIAILLQRNPRPWADIFMRLEFALVLFGTVITSYITTIHKNELIECLRNTFSYQPHCVTKTDQDPVTRRYKAIHSFLLGWIIVFMQYSIVDTLFLSPWVRYRPTRTVSPTYILLPIWYPVDIMSSNILFWCAVVYEFLSIMFTMNLGAVLYFMYLNVTASAAINFAALSYYLERIDTSKTISLEDERINGITKEIGNEKYHEMTLRNSIADYTTLKRHSKSIHRLFSTWTTAVHIHSLLTITFTAFGSLFELRSLGETLESTTHTIIYFSYCSLGILLLFIVNYYASLLQEAHDNMILSLWSCKWTAGSRKFKKLFFNFTTPLNQSLKMGEGTLFPVNVESFSTAMSRIYSFLTFLLQIYASKTS